MTQPNRRSTIGVRVRPNASNFITDLKADLEKKKATFYVDVHANMKPANKEIAEWSRTTLKKIRAALPISANLHQATIDIADFRRKQRGIKTRIPVEAQLGKAYAQVLTFRKIAGKDIEVNLKISTDGANKAAERFEQAIARRGIRLPVDMDPSSVQRTAKKIDTDLIQRLQRQGGVLIDVDADTTGAQAKVDKFVVQKPSVEAQLDLDTKKARLELTRLKARALREKLEVDLSVKRSGIERVMDAIGEVEKRMGSLTVLRSLDLGPITLGKPTGLVGTLTTITLLAGAVPTAVTAVTALSKALVDLAGAASILPGALGGVLASLGTFAIGTQGFGDTLGAMFDVWTEGASEQASTARRAVQAHHQLENALDDEADAQRDVASARREATNDLRNLNNELRGSVLNEAQAILDVQKARDRLAKGGFDSLTDMKQAQLDVAKADQNLIEVRERNAQLQQKVNTENAKGVEGSDRVQQALEAQTRAAQATEQAMEAIASSQATGALGKFNDMLAQLSPNAQAVFQVLTNARGQLQGFKNELQDIIFQGVGPALQGALTNLMPVVGTGMKSIAAGINQNILAVFDTLQTPEGQSIIERILGGTAEAQKAITGLIDPLVRGIGTLTAAGAEHLPQVVDLFTRLADRFANFIEEADKSGKLDEFMDRGIKALEQIAEIGINAIKIVNDLSNAFDGDLLQTIVDLTDKLHTFLSSAEGQNQLKTWIKEAGELWDDWRPILEDLPELFGAVSDAAKVVIDAITPFLNLFTSAMKNAPWLVQGFVTAWLGTKVLVGVASPLFRMSEMIKGIVNGAKQIPGLLRNLPPTPTPGAPGAPGTPGSPGGGATNKGGAATKGGPKGGAPSTPKGGGPKGAPVLGPGLGPTIGLTALISGTLAAIGQHEANDAEIQAVADAVNAAGSDAEKNKILMDYYQSKGIDTSQLPKPGSLTYGFLADEAKAGRIPGVGVNKDGRLVDAATGKIVPGFNTGGYTDWGRTIGRAAILHGGEYVEPHDVVNHYGVGAMKAIHEKRVPKGLLQSFDVGGLFAPFPLKPFGPMPLDGVGGQLGNTPPIVPDTPPTAPDVSATPPITHGPPQPGAVPTTPAPVPGQTYTGPAPGPVGPDTTTPNSLANTPVGPMGDTEGPSIDLFGFKIPLGTSGMQQQQQQVDFSDPAIWPFGIPGIGAPGTKKEDAGKWLAEWGAKTLMGFGEAVLGGVLGFFGAEGILNSPYFNALRTTIGYYSALPGAVSNAITAPGAEQTAAGVDTALNTYYSMPGNPPTGAPGSMPQIYDAQGNLITIGTTATVGKEFEGSGVIAPQKGSEFVATHAQAPNAQVVPNANIMSYLQQEAAKFGLTSNPNYRSSEPSSQHAIGRALDLFGPPEQRRKFLEWWHSDPSRTAATRMLIDDNNTDLETYAGKAGVGPYSRGDHGDHIHAALEGVPASAFMDPSMVPAIAGTDVVDTSTSGAPVVTNWGTTVNGQSLSGTWFQGYNGPLPSSNTESVRQRGLPKGYHPTPKKSQSIGIKQAAAGTPLMSQPPLQAKGRDWSKYKEQLKGMAKQLYMRAGMPAAEWPAFERLIEKESSWDPTAKNPASTAYGLGQFLDITDAQYGPRTDNPFVQLPRIFQYIRDRYHGSPAEALKFHNEHNWYDHGGWLMPGQSTLHNATGKPELIVPMDQLPGFFGGGMMPMANPNWEQLDPKFPGQDPSWHIREANPGSQPPGTPPDQPSIFLPPPVGSRPGAVPSVTIPGFTTPGIGSGAGGGIGRIGSFPDWIKAHPIIPGFQRGGLFRQAATVPLPRPLDARTIQPRPQPQPQPQPRPRPAPVPAPSVGPAAPAPAPSAPPTAGPGVPTPPPTVAPVQIGTGPGIAGSTQDHLHPAISKGIMSGAAVLGNIAQMAAAAGSFGIAGLAGGIAGAAGGGGGGGGPSIAGAIQQAGKIVKGIANVGASFLVGNVTNGTTENPYGVTQRGSNPTGGNTTVVDRSVNMGDVTTQDPDMFFKRLDLREAQSRAMLGRFG